MKTFKFLCEKIVIVLLILAAIGIAITMSKWALDTFDWRITKQIPFYVVLGARLGYVLFAFLLLFLAIVASEADKKLLTWSFLDLLGISIPVFGAAIGYFIYGNTLDWLWFTGCGITIGLLFVLLMSVSVYFYKKIKRNH